MSELRNRIKELRYVKAGDLRGHGHNWRRHPDFQRSALEAVLAEVGIADALVAYEKDGNLVLIDGHLRKDLSDDTEWPVLVLDVDDAEADKLLATLDPLAALAEADAEILEALLATVETEDAALTKMLEELALDAGIVEEPLPLDTDLQLTRADVPDALWPSDNEWGIPSLDLSLQATAVDLPVSLWGAAGRKKRMKGTWVFYCDDYRFEALWKDPSGVVNTQCASAVEPNFTIGPQTPRAVALWHVYRKRYLARWWQSRGVRILVDMNVDTTTFADIMMLGVPRGWKAYATRGYTDRLEFTIAEYELACMHAGTENILFLLYGGGRACKALAREREWAWVPEHMAVKRGGVVDG